MPSCWIVNTLIKFCFETLPMAIWNWMNFRFWVWLSNKYDADGQYMTIVRLCCSLKIHGVVALEKLSNKSTLHRTSLCLCHPYRFEASPHLISSEGLVQVSLDIKRQFAHTQLSPSSSQATKPFHRFSLGLWVAGLQLSLPLNQHKSWSKSERHYICQPPQRNEAQSIRSNLSTPYTLRDPKATSQALGFPSHNFAVTHSNRVCSCHSVEYNLRRISVKSLL